MNDLHQFLRFSRHESLDKVHIIPLMPDGRPVGCLQHPPVDKVLRSQRVSVFFPESVQCRRAHGEIIACPVCEPDPAAGIVTENPDKIVKKRGQANHICLRIVFAPFPQPAFQIYPCVRMPRIKLAQVLACPVVRCMVVHIDFFPDPPAEERHRIPVILSAVPQYHPAVFVTPVFPGHLFPGRPIPHLPVAHGFRCIVDFKLLAEISFHRPDFRCLRHSQHRIGAQECLLLGFRMALREFIVFPDDADRGVNPVSRVRNLRRQFCPVAVADDVRSPSFRHLQGQFFISGFTGQCESAFSEILHAASASFCLYAFLLCLRLFRVYRRSAAAIHSVLRQIYAELTLLCASFPRPGSIAVRRIHHSPFRILRTVS